MNPLKHLASLLLPVMQESAEWMPSGGGIDVVIAQMEARFKSRRVGQIPEDHQLEAVRRFWQSQEILSFRDAYLLLELMLTASTVGPMRHGGPCSPGEGVGWCRWLEWKA